MNRTQQFWLGSVSIATMLAATSAWSADQTYRFDIPAEPVTQALADFSQTSSQQIIFSDDLVKGRRSPGLHGTYNSVGAVRQLLSGTDLVVETNPEGVLMVQPKNAEAASADDGAASPGGAGVEVVMVTAEKRLEDIQNTPVPVTVVNAKSLLSQGSDRLQDYYATVPGLSVIQTGGGKQAITIRGITTGDSGNPTVGVTIDDVPFGSSTSLADGQALLPDLDPADLANIEVLRGPQGTLYGASSIGGLIKYVTTDPSADGFSGRVQIDGQGLPDGSFGAGVRGQVNVPLSDTLAVTVSGFTRHDPGYVDNVRTGADDVNQADVYGGRVSALWTPNDTMSLKISALIQHTNGGGSSAVGADGDLQPILGDLLQSRMKGTEGYSADTRLYTATFSAKIGAIDFVSITGYGQNKYFQTLDYSGIGFYNAEAVSIWGGSSAATSDLKTNKFTQELRLSSSIDTFLDWQIGAFYTNEKSPVDEAIVALNPGTGAFIGPLIDFDFPSSLTEYAIFGDLTFHITDQIDLQLGGRESWNKQVYNEVDTGPLTELFFGSPPPFVNATERTTGNPFTFVVAPSYKITPDLMAYARVSSGYRVGGLNINAVSSGVPVHYAPDKTNNYELGVKGDLFGNLLTYDASAYYIDWHHIQITLRNMNGNFVANAGDAKSEGLEFSLQSRPLEGLSLAATAVLSNAELTQDIPPAATAFGLSGDPLPYSSKFSGSLSADQDIPLSDAWMATVGGTVSYVGTRYGDFAGNAAAPRLRFPSYTDLDLRAGLRHDTWAANVYIKNVGNERGVVGGNSATANAGYDVFYIQPLTLGFNIAKQF